MGKIQLPDGRDICYPFEHDAIVNVVLDAIFLSGYGQYVRGPESFDNLLAVGAAAVLCSLQEFSSGTRHSITFSAVGYRAQYDGFISLINNTVKKSPVLLDRWTRFCVQMLARGRLIAGMNDSL